MASIGSDGFWDLTDALNPSAKKETRLVSAVVTNVDDEGVAWVHIPSAEDETPINGVLTAEVKPGDQVQVEIESGRANLVGNATSPAVGQEQVTRTVAPVAEKAETAATQASEASSTADAARAIAEATGQHFWHDDSGAHISTEANNPEGAQNSWWNSLGMLFRQGTMNLLALVTGSNPGVAIYDGVGNLPRNIVAQFLGDRAVVGRSTSARTEVSADGIDFYRPGIYAQTSSPAGRIRAAAGGIEQVIDTVPGLALPQDAGASVGLDTFAKWVSDLAGSPATATLEVTAGGMTHTMTATVEAYATTYSLADGDVTATVEVGAPRASAHGSESTITVYNTGNIDWSAGTLTLLHPVNGYGASVQFGSNLGDCGANTLSSGDAAEATGLCSAAVGKGASATGEAQTALGRFNTEDPDPAFIIGNGTSDSARSDALTVAWDGHITLPTISIPNNDTGIMLAARNVSDSDSTAAANTYSRIFGLADSAEVLRSYLAHVDATNGQQGVQLETRRVVNGGDVYNGVQLRIDPSGARSVVLSDAAAWLRGLGTHKTATGSHGQDTNVGANAYKDFDVSFGTTFASAPQVVVGLSSTSTAVGIGNISVAVLDNSITTTGCKVRIFNAGTTARSPGFRWAAFGY